MNKPIFQNHIQSGDGPGGHAVVCAHVSGDTGGPRCRPTRSP